MQIRISISLYILLTLQFVFSAGEQPVCEQAELFLFDAAVNWQCKGQENREDTIILFPHCLWQPCVFARP